MTEPSLELKNICQQYRQGRETIDALRGVSLTLTSGESVALMGPSGCGKSTLLKVAGLLLSPTSGVTLLNGSEVPAGDAERARIRNEQIGYVHQDFAMIESLTALENVMLPLDYARPRLARRMRRQRAKEHLDLVGLADKSQARASQLSGGQRQRVAVARALVSEPTLLLADEPTAALDAEAADVVLSLLLGSADRRLGFLIATHDQRVADRCDRVVHIMEGTLC